MMRKWGAVASQEQKVGWARLLVLCDRTVPSDGGLSELSFVSTLLGRGRTKRSASPAGDQSVSLGSALQLVFGTEQSLEDKRTKTGSNTSSRAQFDRPRVKNQEPELRREEAWACRR